MRPLMAGGMPLKRCLGLIGLVALACTLAVLAVGHIRGQGEPIAVAIGLDMPLTPGAAIDPSDRNAADLYKIENPKSRIQILNTYNNADPSKARAELQQAIDQGIQFFVNTQASSHAVECLSLFESDRALSINVSATSTRLSHRDDYFLRLIPDLRREQISVARSLAKLPGRRLLILQDTGNLAYTDPALNVFQQELARSGSWQRKLKRLRFTDYQPNQLEAVLQQPFDSLYILGGSFIPSIGNIAQQFHHAHPQASILLTPWARSPIVLSHSGNAAERILQTSPYPDAAEDEQLRHYLNRFQRRFGYEPYAMSIGTRQALELLDQAFTRGHRSPKAVKHYLLSRSVHRTSLGLIRLNEFGDSMNQLYAYPLVASHKGRTPLQ